jgi:hypothetical protein
MTNEEKIKQMTTNESADLIDCSIAVFCCEDCKYNPRTGTCKKDCKKGIIEWLGAEAEKDWYLIRRKRLLEIKKSGRNK